MAKLTLQNIAGGYGTTTKINANNDAIETALENTLSRDGTSPNQMNADFDMNGYKISNLAAPSADTDAARLVDITAGYTFQAAPSAVGQAGKGLVSDGTNLIYSTVLTGASGLNATNLTSGTVPDARFPATLPAVSGLNLTSLNATNIGSGTLNSARLPAGVAFTTASANFTVGLQFNGNDVGYREVVPVTHSTTSAYALTTANRNQMIKATSTGGWNIPLNSVQAFPIGSLVTMYNDTAATLILSCTAGVTLRIAGTATGGSGVSRNIAQRGLVTICKVNTDEWVASGGGLS